jgi:hypothetical protein
MPPLNLSAKARLVVYIVTGVGSALVAYLVAKDIIGDAEVTLWAAIAALVNGLAAVNVSDRSTHLFLPDDRRPQPRLPDPGRERNEGGYISFDTAGRLHCRTPGGEEYVYEPLPPYDGDDRH